MPAKQASASQLQLLTLADSEEGWWQCRGIFTPNYLRQHLQSEHLPSVSECQQAYEEMRKQWLNNLAGLRHQNEAYTRSKFLDVALQEMRWSFIPEQHLPAGATKKRPDYCLFEEEATEQRVAAGNATDIFRASSTVLEAKKAEFPLDKISEKEDKTPGLFPSQQVQNYLSHARDNNGRFFGWAILTNGNEWRLYCEKAAPDACFVFHLAQGDEFCPLEEFRLFFALLRPTAYTRDGDGRCFLDVLRDESLTHQEKLESNLRKRVFNVLEELAEGFYNNPDNGLAGADLQTVYDNSLIFLYRLLFILYAESRGLLPAKLSGPNSNRRYRQDFSLVRLSERLRDLNAYDDDAFYNLYEDLLKLFHLVNGTHKPQNESLNVTRYNGGLFDPHGYPHLEKWRVGEKTLAAVLRQLVFAQPPARKRSVQQVITTDETVDYASLEVRQLGDIYEGLLGGHLADRGQGRLELVNDNGDNHQQGIFYTPDWVVRYLVQETLQPLISGIEQSVPVQTALKAKSDEKRQDNSFALAVLGLSVVDPAMGSGHFLVRATEALAEQILYHPTTRIMTEAVSPGPLAQQRRSQILNAGHVPVAPGVPQEQAEIAYWRRRVVESCIYGVDANPLAVELAKLSLWLTCIAVDEPLSFLSHHLRPGNSLISAKPEEAQRLPVLLTDEEKQITVDIGAALTDTVREVIAANMQIAGAASTEMEVVKDKEKRWKAIRGKLQPFLDTLDLWIATLDGLTLDDQQLNAFDYKVMVLSVISSQDLTPDEKRHAEKLWEALREELTAKTGALHSFHWQLEFPAVYYQEDGALKPEHDRGFDAILGNPPYISTHTSSESRWRSVVESRMGYVDDLYVNFTDLGFHLLRTGGMFGFIVSDTFFTLESKARMRGLLQGYCLTHLGQCDPFDATVDAALFVARKQRAGEDDRLLFVQARYPDKIKPSLPERELPALPAPDKIPFPTATADMDVRHGAQGCLRLHDAPLQLYRDALKNAFFEPHPAVLRLYQRFNEPLKTLVDEWWDRIADSRKFAENRAEIQAYQATLKPGDVTLVGLIAEGGQGMRTANNARFLAYLAGTPKAQSICDKRAEWTQAWLKSDRIRPVFSQLLEEHGGQPANPTANVAAWEAAIEPLKARFDSTRDLGFSKTDLYRVVQSDWLADQSDFEFAWRQRKAELLPRWQRETLFNGFWTQTALEGYTPSFPASQLPSFPASQLPSFPASQLPSFPASQLPSFPALRAAQDVSDAEFCALCQALQAWIEAHKKGQRKLREALGLRSSESYKDPADAPRVATIYNGLSGRGLWVPFRKGDPDGNRWVDNEPLYIDWSAQSVNWLSTSPAARWQGHKMFFTAGITWTAVANHVGMKARYQEPCVFDADSMRLTPQANVFSPLAFLALLNSDVLSFFKLKLIKHTQKWEIGDLRLLPVVMPTATQAKHLTELSEWAMQAKRLTLTDSRPSQELVAYARTLEATLTTSAPKYLRPSAQLCLLSEADHCLDMIELAINWEAEKLYGVENLGPFNEF